LHPAVTSDTPGVQGVRAGFFIGGLLVATGFLAGSALLGNRAEVETDDIAASTEEIDFFFRGCDAKNSDRACAARSSCFCDWFFDRSFSMNRRTCSDRESGGGYLTRKSR
jgi:hypothetical protein